MSEVFVEEFGNYYTPRNYRQLQTKTQNYGISARAELTEGYKRLTNSLKSRCFNVNSNI